MTVGLHMAYESHRGCDLAMTKPCNVCLLGSREDSIYAVNLKLIDGRFSSAFSRVKVIPYK